MTNDGMTNKENRGMRNRLLRCTVPLMVALASVHLAVADIPGAGPNEAAVPPQNRKGTPSPKAGFTSTETNSRIDDYIYQLVALAWGWGDGGWADAFPGLEDSPWATAGIARRTAGCKSCPKDVGKDQGFALGFCSSTHLRCSGGEVLLQIS